MGKTIKVLQVNKLYYPAIGGIEQTLQQISEGLNKRADIDLKVLVCQEKGKGKTETVNGVKVYRCASFGVVASVPISLSFLWNFRKLAKSCDIVQFHLPFPLGDLACLLSGYKGKVVVYWHSDVVKQKRWLILYRPIMELFLKRADLILVGAKGIARGSLYLKPYLKKCKVVPFAVKNSILEAGGRYLSEYGYDRRNRRVRFLFIGRLVYYKGCSVLVAAMKQLEGQGELVIIGGGNLEDELKEQCSQLGIAEIVKFTGRISDDEIKYYFEQSDVFVLPSIERSEAFALVQLEAMAYGIPVINTNLPSGVPEVSLHMETGLTVEPGDERGLAEAMKWMAEHKEERLGMGMKARKRVEEMYTEERMIKNLSEIYEKIAKDGR